MQSTSVRYGRWTGIGAIASSMFLVAAMAVAEQSADTKAPSQPSDETVPTEPILREDGRLIFPDNVALPRSLTDAERRFIEREPLSLLAEQTPPPTGPLLTPAEYDPMDGVFLSYRGVNSWLTILDQMAANITTIGDADVIAIVPNSSDIPNAITRMTNAGADMDRVTVLAQPTNSIWIRDYGPRYVYEGDVRVIVDHTYNRPRPLDDAIPTFLSSYLNHGYYKLPLVHGGGNYHLDSLGEQGGAPGGGYTTKLINNENPGLTQQQIHDMWLTYQNLTTTFYDPLPANVDATQHIDMWMQVIGDDKVIISTWPANPGSVQQQICDAAAADFTSRGFTVYRTPARVLSGTHYTYTNMVVVNDLVLLPSYTNSTISPYNSQALAVVQSAVPGKTVVPINCQAIVTAAGVMHCIMMHLPAHQGNGSPTAYLRHPRGGAVYEVGETVTIEWISDAVTTINSVDLLLSTNGGDSFDHTIGSGISNSGEWQWTVPDLPSAQARVRVVVHDANGNSGFDQSDSNFAIVTEAIVGDLNGDGVVDVADLLILFNNWGPCPYGACCLAGGGCTIESAADCAAIGGTYQGDGVSCGDVQCPLPPGQSCSGHCGQQAPSGCWCDELCCSYNDCCDDKHDVCGGCDPGALGAANGPGECTGDLNNDGVVNVADLIILFDNWG
jgi:agmatine deiminase